MMLIYDKEVIEVFYQIDKTSTLVEIILDIKNGYKITKEGKELVLKTIEDLKKSNQWNYEIEARLLKEYQYREERKKTISKLSPKDRELYNKKSAEKISKLLEEYDFTL